ncbi:MAG: undecaprenyl/decaprenyl-phosphate alpha-N-acetylglucosaminyl 1-phosphate transferase [Bacteroidetes bacterium]|jgi:UDP-N-acetylmuramyl pentapeptide phosphotransferase/UDP-N-acetylglucosamine-1-phosphate transferase|nr:undecaprenyl/decaprenyl-phosphate alpha-N-acetylglucosaminyl 1-phosphate transferase [Bacteroidota bacterium]
MISPNHLVHLAIAMFSAGFIVYIAIPVVLKISREKKLYDEPNERSAATTIVPTLGGIAIFIGLLLSIILASNELIFPELRFIIASMVILFFIGLKDDILVISPRKKLIAQLLASFILIYYANIRITHLHGLFGIHELTTLSSYFISVFVMVVIINAFNLIDGIDGLASGVAIICGLAFGAWFAVTGYIPFSILSFGLVGALGVFFYYNVFSKGNKIFMGDTGSLIIGSVFAILVIKFNELNVGGTIPYAVKSAPAVSFGILIVPLFDTIRVFSLRLSSGKSPFSPDKNHVHHRLLEIGYSHFQASLRIILVNVFFIAINILLQNIGLFNLLMLNVSLGIIFSFIPAYILFTKTGEKRTFNKYLVFQINLNNGVKPISEPVEKRIVINKPKITTSKKRLEQVDH